MKDQQKKKSTRRVSNQEPGAQLTAVELCGAPEAGLASGAAGLSAKADASPEVVAPERVLVPFSAARFFSRQCRVRRGRALARREPCGAEGGLLGADTRRRCFL